MRLETREQAKNRARRAPIRAVESLYRRIFRRAIPRGFFTKTLGFIDVAAVLREFPQPFDPNREFNDRHWIELLHSLRTGYEDIIAAVATTEDRNRGFIRKMAEPGRPVTLDEYLRTVTGEAIKGISEAIRAAIAQIMELSGPLTRQKQQQIRQLVGLSRGQQGQIVNRFLALGIQVTAEGLREFEQQASRLSEVRIRAIARTEATGIRNRGLLQSWVDAQARGDIDSGFRKMWVSLNDERISDICVELDAQRVPLDQQFQSSEGSFFAPPAHVNCRSTMVLTEGEIDA